MNKIVKTDAEWREELTPEEFAVTRKKGTERAFSGRYWNNHDAGVYRCACCGTALFRSDDYARAGVPMLPVVAGPDATRLQILLYTIVLVAIAAAPWPLGYFDAAYGVTSLVLGAGMLALAINVFRRRERTQSLRATRKLFAFSILYLFALFATLLVEVVVRAVVPGIG